MVKKFRNLILGFLVLGVCAGFSFSAFACPLDKGYVVHEYSVNSNDGQGQINGSLGPGGVFEGHGGFYGPGGLIL